MWFVMGSPEAMPLRLLVKLLGKDFNLKNSRAATMQK